MQQYAVLLTEKSGALREQIVDGYLGWDGIVMTYDRNTARSKARLFGPATVVKWGDAYAIEERKMLMMKRKELTDGTVWLLDLKGKKGNEFSGIKLAEKIKQILAACSPTVPLIVRNELVVLYNMALKYDMIRFE